MSLAKNLWLLAALGIATVFAPGCSSAEVEEEEEGSEDELTISSAGQWVVDMKKVKQHYFRQGDTGQTSKYFFGLAPEEAGLCKVGADGQPEAACAQLPIVWDQGFRFNEDHTPVDPTKKMAVVKMEDGRMVEMQGMRLNIIPLIKDTDPTDQAHLRKYLQDGDALAFFHPEQREMRNLMDRRVSHVAMHYEFKSADGVEYVHHIDNPNSYGPQYNFAPDRQMPFHVFRYKPKGMSAEKAKAYGLNSRNWGFIDDDRSPFADFFTLTLQKYEDLAKFRDAALAGQEIPKVYCSGLAYTNMNLGINFPLRPDMLRPEGYSRDEIKMTALGADVLAPPSSAELTPANRLVYEPYTTSELSNAWLDNTYALLPPVAPEGKPSRRAIALNEKTQAGIIAGLKALQWGDVDKAEANQPPQWSPENPNPQQPNPVATPARIKAWADAYGLDASQTEAWLARNAELGAEVSAQGIATAGKKPMEVLKALEIKVVGNRFVPPRIWLDEANHRQWSVMPQLLPMLPSKADVDLVYVGTVVNCELLSSANGNQATACRGTGARIKEFSEGGADTSTYPHYAILNGMERTHRRFDASPFSRGRDRDGTTEPRSMGKGTVIKMRASAAEMGDVKFLFHTPDMNSTLPANLQSLSVKGYDAACTAMYKEAIAAQKRASCAPKQAIVLDPAKANEAESGTSPTAGKAWDDSYTFDLTKVCSMVSDKTMKCTVAEQAADGGWTIVGEREVSREIPKKKGFISATMIDTGAKTEGVQVDELCTACNAGGAHFNQWVATIRNDEVAPQ